MIVEVETGCFAPEAARAKLLQLFPEFSNGRFAPLFRLTKKVIAKLSHTARPILARNHGSKNLLKLHKPFVDRPHGRLRLLTSLDAASNSAENRPKTAPSSGVHVVSGSFRAQMTLQELSILVAMVISSQLPHVPLNRPFVNTQDR